MNSYMISLLRYFLFSPILAATLAVSSTQAYEFEATLGAQSGYSSSRSQFTDTSPNDSSLTEFPINGPVLSLYANASLLINIWSLGIEVDYMGLEQSSRTYTNDLLANTSESKRLSFKNRQDLSLLLGYQFSEQVMFYLRGGFSRVIYDFSSYDSDSGTSQFDLKLTAPHYGLGFSVRLTEHLSLRTGYRFATFSGNRTGGNTTTNYSFDVHSFLAGLGYTF